MLQSITIKIADQAYPLKVTSPEHEEIIRKAAAEVNSKIAFWLERHPEKKLSEILSLVALKMCISNIQLQNQAAGIRTEVEEFAAEIESYLDNIDKNSR